MRRRWISLILLCALLLCIGCDAVDLSEQIFAINLALDTGEGAALRLTVQCPQIVPTGRQPAQSDEDLQQNGYVLHQVEGGTIEECLELMRMVTPRRLSLMQLRGLYLSESLAKDAELLRGSLTVLGDAQVTRPSAQVYLTRGRAEDVLKRQMPLFGARLSKAQAAQTAALSRQGVIPDAPLHRFASALLGQERSATAVLAAVNNRQYIASSPAHGVQPAAYLAGELPRRTADALDLCGCAVFGEENILFLDGYETQLLNLLNGKLRNVDMAVDGRMGTVEIQHRPTIDVEMEGEATRIVVKMAAEADGVFAERLYGDILDLLLKLQQGGVDPVGIGERMKRMVWTDAEWEEMAWEEVYASSTIKIVG